MYHVLPTSRGYRVHRNGQWLDTLRTASGAAHAVRMLEVGACRVDVHGIVGCRIVPLVAPVTAADVAAAARAGADGRARLARRAATCDA